MRITVSVYLLIALFLSAFVGLGIAIGTACAETYDNMDLRGLRQVERNSKTMYTNDKIKALMSEPESTAYVTVWKKEPAKPDIKKLEADLNKEVSYSECVNRIEHSPEYTDRIKFLINSEGREWRKSGKQDRMLLNIIRNGLDKCMEQANNRDGL